MTVDGRDLSFAAKDDWPLSGTLYSPSKPLWAILVSGGTGYPRQFYRHVAGAFAARGAAVLTYDYRGINGSRQACLKGSDIDLPDWGRLDLSAAIDALEELVPDRLMLHLAHSAGGHFIGLAETQHKFDRHAFLSVGTGYFGGHHLKNIPMEMYFWWCLGPLSLMRHGYLATGGGWRGEPLPPKVFRTWRRWSHRASYFEPELLHSSALNFYHKVEAPIQSWVFTDDPIATPQTAKRVLECYPNAQTQLVVRQPSNYQKKKIGHDGAMKKGNAMLWDEIWEWLVSS